MQPKDIVFGGGTDATLLNPVVAVWMIIAIILILTLPRRKAIVPFLFAFFTIPLGQVVLVGGLHFPVLRILILAGLVRRMISPAESSGSKFAGGFRPVDQAVVMWTVSLVVVLSLRWMDLQAIIKFVGDFLDSLGGYLVVRYLIPDRETVRRTARVFALLCLILGACMINEHFSSKNVFGYLGGGAINAEVRDGRVRAGGVLGTIQSGTFGGVLIPLFLWLGTERKSRLTAVAGIAGATAMVITCGASTGLMAYLASFMGLCFWPLRKQMRIIRWGIVAILVGLQLVMHGPVWSLIEHIDVRPGSSSYHRYMLIDTLIRHFGDWWLLGTTTNGSWGWEMWDTCNQFVDVAVRGGLVALTFYIVILKRSFATLGNARKRASGDRNQEWFLWCLGSCLFANVVTQFGINYMIQLQLLLFPLLASISIAALESRHVAIQSKEQLKGIPLKERPITAFG